MEATNLPDLDLVEMDDEELLVASNGRYLISGNSSEEGRITKLFNSAVVAPNEVATGLNIQLSAEARKELRFMEQNSQANEEAKISRSIDVELFRMKELGIMMSVVLTVAYCGMPMPYMGMLGCYGTWNVIKKNWNSKIKAWLRYPDGGLPSVFPTLPPRPDLMSAKLFETDVDTSEHRYAQYHEHRNMKKLSKDEIGNCCIEWLKQTNRTMLAQLFRAGKIKRHVDSTAVQIALACEYWQANDFPAAIGNVYDCPDRSTITPLDCDVVALQMNMDLEKALNPEMHTSDLDWAENQKWPGSPFVTPRGYSCGKDVYIHMLEIMYVADRIGVIKTGYGTVPISGHCVHLHQVYENELSVFTAPQTVISGPPGAPDTCSPVNSVGVHIASTVVCVLKELNAQHACNMQRYFDADPAIVMLNSCWHRLAAPWSVGDMLTTMQGTLMNPAVASLVDDALPSPHYHTDGPIFGDDIWVVDAAPATLDETEDATPVLQTHPPDPPEID